MFFFLFPMANLMDYLIEMKAPKGKTSKYQEEWLSELAAKGYDTAVCVGFDEARKKIMEYITL